MVSAGLRNTYADFKLLQEIEATEVSGLMAAHARAQHTVTIADGTAFKVLLCLGVVPRGALRLLIGMGRPAEGPEVWEGEFDAALGSIEIER